MISEQEILNASTLIVDDQQSNVILLEQMLRDIGYVSVSSTMDPYTVCELHRKNRYDLILLDLQMPGLDGFQVMEGLKKIEAIGYVPILVITAKSDHKLRALAAGAKDFVAKPFDLIEVQTRIHNILEVRLLYRKLEHNNHVLEHYNQVLGQAVLKQTAELRQCESRIQHLSERSSDWYWEQDKHGRFTKIYGPVLEMMGIRVDDVLGNTRSDQGMKWNEAERETLEANLFARRSFLDFIYSRTTSDGLSQYLMVSGEPMFDGFGCFTGYRGTGKDVTPTMLQSQVSAAKH
jgi:CheY-like chemotaxis protein